MQNADKWQTVTIGADVTKQVTALTELIASADADINQLGSAISDGSANADLTLKWDLDKTVKKDKYKETIWDKDVWHEIQLASRAYCTVQSEIEAGIYKTPEQYSSAISQLQVARDYLLTAKKKAESSTTP